MSRAATPALLWFRSDLRLHDNPALAHALSHHQWVLSVYCFDPREYGTTSFGFPKTGAFRTAFRLETVRELKASLQEKGGDLYVVYAQPEEVIPRLCQKHGIRHIHYHPAATSEELRVEQAVERSLEPLGVMCEPHWSGTLLDPQDLPYPLVHVPDNFTRFYKDIRRELEPGGSVDVLPAPARVPGLPDVAQTRLPTWVELGQTGAPPPLRFPGGEAAALDRLNNYIWRKDRLREYFETRNGMLAEDDSSKLSPWLAAGALSPRLIWQQVRAYEQERVRNKSTEWLVYELVWRDYFRLIAVKHRERLFRPDGLRAGQSYEYVENPRGFAAWRDGQTGIPVVDANMRELAQTGFLSNRGRQLVASYLCKDLRLNWLLGAEYFESQLIDYDVHSNYGNWSYVAGVGNDPREDRYFHMLKQSERYDPKADYLKHWLPELTHLSPEDIHALPLRSEREWQRLGLRQGVDYPKPIYVSPKWRAAS